MVSVITVNFNNLNGLVSTYNSLLEQSFKNAQWVVVDGGSTDGSYEFLCSVVNSLELNIRFISESDHGIYNAMNKGVEMAKYDYCIFMNSGDRFYSGNALSLISDEILADSGCDVFLYGFKLKNRIQFPKSIFFRFWSLPTSHQAIVYRASLLKLIKYDEELRFAADYSNFLEIVKVDSCVKRMKFVIAENEPYGSDSSLDEVRGEYITVLAKYFPYKVSFIFHSFRFFVARTLLRIRGLRNG